MYRRAAIRTLAILSTLAASPIDAGAQGASADAPTRVCEAGFAAPDPAAAALGRLLFYDPILSGGRTVSCAGCHRADLGTSDGVSLSLGDGGVGAGAARKADPDNLPEQRIPRNAQALFNLGAAEFRVFFHDGRLEAKGETLRTPLGGDMAKGFASALSAQAMFPVLSPDEMAGHYGESDVSAAVRKGRITQEDGAWAIIAARVAAIPAYRDGFAALQGEGPIAFTDIADAIADFIAFEWRADDSPYDRFLCGGEPLSAAAERGRVLFEGKAGCADCHAGRFQTDHAFHAIAMPQIGPGKAARFERHVRDTGRMRVTGRAEDAYRFRTPSLRNASATAPYGHAGAYATLDAAIRHHLDPVAALKAYDRAQAILPALPGASDFQALDDPAELDAIAAANELRPMDLTEEEVADLIMFLHALTDEMSLNGRLGAPEAVPSGLPLD